MPISQDPIYLMRLWFRFENGDSEMISAILSYRKIICATGFLSQLMNLRAY